MKRVRVPPVVIIMLSFLSTILVGMILLKLPISLNSGVNLSLVDSFFISTSAICVTGLAPVFDISATFSIFGKIILALLIQIGGLGCITVATYFFVVFGVKLGISDRYLLKEALNQDKVSNILKLLKSIIKITITIELIGAFINFLIFSRHYDFFTAIGISLFHSISSFNNAGFDILGSNSLINYSDSILLNINTTILIILGGLGFIVIADLLRKKFNYKKLTIHSKVVLVMTGVLIIVGTLTLKLSMHDNVTWLQALFLSVSSRTAGFSTINCAMLTSSSIIITSILMIIGASPSSTGGGIKTTTFYIMIKSMTSFAKGKPTIINNKKVSEESKMKAFTLFFLAVSIIAISSIIIMLIEENNSTIIGSEEIVFESISAFANVGLSMGITPYLSLGSKLIICMLMFFGRIGPITIMGMWNSNWNKPSVNNVEYLEEKMIIG